MNVQTSDNQLSKLHVEFIDADFPIDKIMLPRDEDVSSDEDSDLPILEDVCLDEDSDLPIEEVDSSVAEFVQF